MRKRLPLFLFLAAISASLLPFLPLPAASAQQTPATTQRLVESVTIQGNRRTRAEDLLYYVQTREREPYSEAQVQRDFQALMNLGFFDRLESRVEIQDGPLGGVEVIFHVRELPVIRQLRFDGMSAVTEADALRAFRESRVGISQEAIFDPVKSRNAIRILREMLAARGYPNATVTEEVDDVSLTSIVLTYRVNQGERVRVVEINFEGNQIFSDGQLRRRMQLVREAGLITRFRGQDILDRRKLEEDLRRVTFYMRSRGYLQARTGEPRIEDLGQRRTGFFIPLPVVSSTDDAIRVTVPVVEGRVFRIGQINIEGNSIFSEQQIRAVIGLNPGDIADGERIGKALFEDLKNLYGTQGFLQYTPEIEPTYRDNPQNPNEGIADFTVTISEGRQFTLRRLEFLGNNFTRDNVLRREVALNEGDIYNQSLLDFSVLRLNQLGFFDPIDKERDVEFRQNEEQGEVDVNLRVTERGRNQIAFNGGFSGIGGSFFGLEYSTSNLLGRGESLSFNLAYGNRQRSFLFSFTEPYVRDRPITIGFSVYSQSLKFFGEGTFLSQNVEAQQGLFGSTFDFLNVSDENLFTQTSTGVSVFASAPLSEFYRRRPFTLVSRIGLSYSFSRTSVEDPEVNLQDDQTRFIPVLYRQPNITTSRITPSFVYDTREGGGGIDPVRGTQISASLGFAGLGGDVRTYQPTLSFTQYIPVRRTGRDQNPEVFAYRILASSIGSFAITDVIRNANSLSFVNGIPIYERFFLGDEYTIRGFPVRSISPVAPIDTFITSRNVVVATNDVGTPVPIAGLQQFAGLGTFTGVTGSNRVQFPRTFTAIGADTQLLGNFEYRIPLFGPVAVAAFADVGTAFNLRGGADQFVSSEFQQDQPFLFSTLGATLNALVVSNNPQLAFLPFTGGLVARDARLVTREELSNAVRLGPIDPNTGLPFGFQQVFFRGEAQTNTAVRISETLFSGIRNYRASLGGELRIQLPVVNVPFRLFYAYNLNTLSGDEIPGLVFRREPRTHFRFSIGRTF